MHNLIVGASFSGKTNLAKAFAKNAVKIGENVVVFDPLKSTGWPKEARKISDPQTFLDAIGAIESAHVFIDEAKTLWDFNVKNANKILYQRRHQGLLVYLIAQRAKMVPPNARDQCSKLFAFKQSLEDADILANGFTSPELRGLVKLKRGDFIATDSYSLELLALDYSEVSKTEKNPPSIKKRDK